MGLKIIEAFYLTLEFVGQNQARGVGNLHRKAGLPGVFIGQPNQGKASTLLGFPHRLHGCHLRRLVFQGIQPVQIPGQNL